MKTQDEYDWVAQLLHFSDSVLPVGAYAHSFGLEGVCQQGVVIDVEGLETFLLRDVSHALLAVDLPLVAKAHAAMMDGCLDEVCRLDQLSWALRPTRQLREAASKIGRQQMKIYENTWGEKMRKLPRQQSPVVVGMTFALEGVPKEAALWSLAYQTYSALVQASLKLVPIGPAATQQLLYKSLSAIAPHIKQASRIAEDEIGSFNPMWDIAASKHERAAARLFLS